jgi:hypothetical protein
MPPRTPVQRLLLLPQTPTPLSTLLTPYLPQPCSRQQRLFSNTPRTLAGVRKSKSFAPRQTGIKQPPQKSFDTMKKEQMKNIEQMPNDVGLIPGTFIMPTGPRLPSFTSEFSARFALEKHRLWLRIKEIFGYVDLVLPSFSHCAWILIWVLQSPIHGLLPRLPPRRPPETSLPLATNSAKTSTQTSNSALPLEAPMQA